MMNYKRKLLPVEPYETDALESWFSALSAEGLHVYSANPVFATFAEGEEKRLLYRMEPKKNSLLPNAEDAALERQKALHQEKGWQFVCELGHCFYIYAAEEGTADDFATPEEESKAFPAHGKTNSLLNSSWALLLFEFVILAICIAVEIFLMRKQTAYDWVRNTDLPFDRLPLLLCAIAMGQRSLGMNRLRKSLAAGNPHHQPADWQDSRLRRKHRLYYVWFVAMIASLFLPFLSYAFQFSDKPIAEVTKPFPLVSLAELENDPDFYPVDTYYQRDSGSREDWWERESGMAYSTPTIGSPVDISYNQAGRIPNKTDAAGEPYESVLWVEYKKLASFVSPKEYIEEYFDHWDSAYADYECTVPEDTPFDYAFLAKSKERTELYLVSGQKLLELDYCYGDVDLTEHYDLYEKAMQQMK